MDDLIAFLRAQLDEREFQYGQAPEVYGWELADVAAKRQIIRLLQSYDSAIRQERDTAKIGDALPGNLYAARDAVREAVRLLALPYAGHPGYRPEWKP